MYSDRIGPSKTFDQSFFTPLTVDVEILPEIFPGLVPEIFPRILPEIFAEIFTGKFPGIVETLFVGAEEGGITSTNPFKNSG